MAVPGPSNRDHDDLNHQQSAMDDASVHLLPQSESQKLLGDNGVASAPGETEISQSETVLDMSELTAAEQCVPHIGHMGKDECVAHISTLHDDVAKMFVKAPRFDMALLSSEPVVSDPRGFGEEDFRSHRQMTFPHVHHPLKSMRSKGPKRAAQQKGVIPKKKKKKRKMKTVRNFPSKTAAQIPAIPEEIEGLSGDSESEDDSEDSDDDFDDDLGIPEEEVLKLRQEADEVEEKEVDTPAILLIEPSDSSTNTLTDSPSRGAGTPGEAVGFYIGDEHLGGSPKHAVASSVPSSSSVQSGTSLKPDKGIEGLRAASSGSVAASKFKRQSSAEPQTTPMFEDIEDEPMLSQHATQSPEKNLSSSVPFLDPGRKASIQSTGSGNKVTFLLGNPSGVDLAASSSGPKLDDKENTAPKSPPPPQPHPPIHSGGKTKSKHRHHHHHEQFKKEDLLVRRQPGSEIQLDNLLKRVPTEVDEASMLQKADLDDMASHRWEDVRGIRRHKIQKFGTIGLSHAGKKEKEKKKLIKVKKKFDHTPHEVFVELDELHTDTSNWQWEWREKARWIKFEEDVEEGAERWGKPHVASLSFHSLLELRKLLEKATLLLDLEGKELPSIFASVVDKMILSDQITEENRGNVLRTLLLKHKHVNRGNAFMRRNISYLNLMGLESSDRRHHKDHSVMKNFSTASFSNMAAAAAAKEKEKDLQSVESGHKLTEHGEYMKLELVKTDVDSDMNSDGLHVGVTLPETPSEEKTKQVQEIMKRIPKDSESAAVLVGTVDFLAAPTMAVVRLSEGQVLGNLTEVPLPVRFVFILLGPPVAMDYHEVGRSLSTLMSNQHFHGIAYKAESREELLHAINEFLDESIVLPPGDWDRKTLLPIMDMARRRATVKRKKKQKQDDKKTPDGKPPIDPLKRTGVPFGGLINDIKRRYPHYVSDFKDAMNPQCLAAFIFIFFACLSPSIAFGGLMGEKTDGYIGVSETILATSIAGVFFGLLSGQPIMIIGYTGPILLFEETLYTFCKSNDLEYLPMRFWVGMWLFLICMVVVATEASFLVRYITRFTEEIFATLISLIFIYEVFNKLYIIFSNHPLVEEYCFAEEDNSSLPINNTQTNGWNYTYTNLSVSDVNDTATISPPYQKYRVMNQPNTALLSLILCLGTFLIAYFLRIFRNSKFLGRSVRRALGDFGVAIAILIMVLIDFALFTDTYTQKLDLPDGLSPTSPHLRGWMVNPMGDKKPIEIWQIFAASIAAMLVFVLIFMESQITQMILNKKERKLKKGSGYHLDMFLIGCIAGFNSIFGMPWLCAATVRSVTHVSALTVMSRTHAPGEKPKLLMVMEQRLTNILVNIFVGISLAMGAILREIPMAVLFGVFLYMGVASLSGVQLFERVKLLLMPVKHHPSVGYVRRVRAMKMHLFTLLQLGCLVVLWVVKSTVIALAFPFLLITLVPLRLKVLKYLFTEKELSELDKDQEDEEEDDEQDEPDFYQMAHMPW